MSPCPQDKKSRPGLGDPSRRPMGPVVNVRSLVALALWALVVVVAFRYFGAVQFVVLGALMAAALASALQPVSDRLPGPASVRATLAVLAALVALGVVFFVLGWFMYEPLRNSVKNLPEFRRAADEGLRRIGASIGVSEELTIGRIVEAGGGILTGGSLASSAVNAADWALSALLAVLVVMVGAVYLLARPDGTLADKAVGLLPPARQAPTKRALEELRPKLRGWVVGTLFSMTVIGVITGCGYWVIGLRFALPLAVLAGLFQAVPTFGPLAAFALSLLVALPQGLTQIIGVAGVYLVVQLVESYFLTPMVMKKAVHIPPIVTLFTIILWGNLFGVAGMVLAIPIDLTIWSLLDQHVISRHREEAERQRAAPTGPDGAVQQDE